MKTVAPSPSPTSAPQITGVPNTGASLPSSGAASTPHLDAGAASRPPGPSEREWIDYSFEMRIVKNPAMRALFVVMGLGAIGMGILGYILPGLPGTVFFLIAAWFFAQSSPRFYNWLMNHRLFGPLIRDYRDGRGIPRWVKIYAPVMIMLFSSWSAYYVGFAKGKLWIAACILAVALYGVWYVLRVPTKRNVA